MRRTPVGFECWACTPAFRSTYWLTRFCWVDTEVLFLLRCLCGYLAISRPEVDLIHRPPASLLSHQKSIVSSVDYTAACNKVSARIGLSHPFARNSRRTLSMSTFSFSRTIRILYMSCCIYHGVRQSSTSTCVRNIPQLGSCLALLPWPLFSKAHWGSKSISLERIGVFWGLPRCIDCRYDTLFETLDAYGEVENEKMKVKMCAG